MLDDVYTGRQIGIFTDAHGLYEPVVAVLDDMKKRNITEIYSLGDNVGDGPSSDKVIDLIKERNVISLAGNSEYYHTLGIEPFMSYMYNRKDAVNFEKEKLGSERIGDIKLYPACITLLIGGKKVALCHFANDVRYDFEGSNSVWSYQRKRNFNEPGFFQFKYTNSKEALEYLREHVMAAKEFDGYLPELNGIIDAYNNPLFEWEKDGEKLKKQVDYFDAIIQGHAHFRYFEDDGKTKYYTLRSVGMAYKNINISEEEKTVNIDGVEYNTTDKHLASYVILKEKKNGGFDYEEVFVPFDRKAMVKDIIENGNPYDQNKTRKFTSVTYDEIESIKQK